MIFLLKALLKKRENIDIVSYLTEKKSIILKINLL